MEEKTKQALENEVVAEAVIETASGFIEEKTAENAAQTASAPAVKLSFLEKRRIRGEKLEKFRDMSQKDKIAWIILIGIGVVYIAITLGHLISTYVAISRGGTGKRIFTYYMAIVIYALIYLIEPVFKVRLNKFLLGLFLFYTLFSVMLGNVFDWYDWEALHTGPIKESFGYDKVMHVALGWMGCLAGLLALCKIGDYEKLKPMTVVLFCIGISMAIGTVWEIAEYAADGLLGQTAQGVKMKWETMPAEGVPFRSGEGHALIIDTMRDIIANSIGMAIFGIHYLTHKKTGKNLGMGTIIKNCIG